MTEAIPLDDGRCFACGPHNPDGLHLVFEPDGDVGARTVTTIPPSLQGYRDIAHGGIIMMLLDEAMAHACRFIGERGMTAAVNVRFRSAVPVGVQLHVRGRYKERRRNMLFLEATVALADGTVVATGDGTFVSEAG